MLGKWKAPRVFEVLIHNKDRVCRTGLVVDVPTTASSTPFMFCLCVQTAPSCACGVGAPLVDEGQVVALQRAAQAVHVVARGGLLNRARACIGACSSRHRVNLQLFSLDTLRYTEL